MLLVPPPSPPYLSSNLRRIPNPLGFQPILLPQPFFRPLPRSSIKLPCRSSGRSQGVVAEPDTAAKEEHLEAAAVCSESVEGIGEGNASEATHLSVGTGISGLTVPFGFRAHRMSLGDQAFFLLAFIACTTSVAFTSLVIAAVPTLLAMKRAAMSLARLADTAREELPSTMAAIRLSGMEISDLTLELSDLSQDIADGVSKSAQAVQAAEAGIRQIGALARHQTMSMIQERANLPNISFKPVVIGAAKKTSHVVGQAKKRLMNMISGTGNTSENEEESNKVET